MSQYRSATLEGAGFTVDLLERTEAGPNDSILEKLPGWFGGAGIEGDNPKRPLGHGLFVSPSTRTGRPMTLGGVLTYSSSAERDLAQRLLSGVLWDGELGRLTVTDAAGLTLSAEVKLDGAIRADEVGPRSVRFEAPLLAPDPFLVSEERLQTIYPAGAGEGLEFPLFGGAPFTRDALAVWPADVEDKGTRAPEWPEVPAALFTGTASVFTDKDIPVDPSTGHYRFGMWLRANGSATTTIALATRYYDEAGAAMSPSATNNYVVDVPTNWTYVERDVPVPAGTAIMRLAFYPNHPNGTTRDAASYDAAIEVAHRPSAITFGGTVQASKVIIGNGGNATAWPRFAIRGTFPGGFRLINGPASIDYPVPTYAQSPVLIDTATGSISIAGQGDVTVRATRRDWSGFGIEAGDVAQPRLHAIADGVGWADVLYHDTYI